MFIPQDFKQQNGRRTAYWALVESHRTATGPRQRVVERLGKLDEAGRLGVKQAASVRKICGSFVVYGCPCIWALHLIQPLQLDSFLEKMIPEGRAHVPWDVSSLILIIARWLEPSSELFIAAQWYPRWRVLSGQRSNPLVTGRR